MTQQSIQSTQTEAVMVYRCTRNDDAAYDAVDPKCGWSTTDYAEIDAHEDQVEPGHTVVGSVERVPVKRSFDPDATADEDDRPCLMCLEEDCRGGCLL